MVDCAEPDLLQFEGVSPYPEPPPLALSRSSGMSLLQAPFYLTVLHGHPGQQGTEQGVFSSLGTLLPLGVEGQESC